MLRDIFQRPYRLVLFVISVLTEMKDAVKLIVQPKGASEMLVEPSIAHRAPRRMFLRILAAIAAALAYCLGGYLLIEATRPQSGLISFAFLFVLPAVVCAFVAYVADPWRERSIAAYLLVPLWILGVAMPFSIIFLREGTICVVILSPLWLISGMAGTAATYSIRHRIDDGRKYSVALFVLPLIVLHLEPMIPLQVQQYNVKREIIVNAAPDKIWPLLEGIPDVQAGEGQWNVSQDIIGVPRPVGARLVGTGLGANRHAKWTLGINFRETITEWEQDRRIGWKFVFDTIDNWEFTDRHLMPDSAYYRVTTGGYTLQPMTVGRTRLTLDTSYWVRTPVNGYSALWGEFFLGDLEENLLTLVKERAEKVNAPVATNVTSSPIT
jgi:hypothetical protein